MNPKKKKNEKQVAQAKKFAEDWLPIKGIVNGAIILENGMHVTGVKIRPKNIFILDMESQNNVIYNMRNLYNTIDYEFWLLITDRPVDIDVYLSALQLRYNSVLQNPAIRKMILEDINKANLFMSKEVNVTDTEYFLLFRDKRPEIIQKRIQSLISNLASSGLTATQTSNEDLRVLLDGFLNGGETIEMKAVMGA